MRAIIWLCGLLPLMAACSWLEQNNSNVRFAPPNVINDQKWQITTRSKLFDHGSVCTVSAGELEVSQLRHNGATSVQVGTVLKMEPGDRYKILTKSHNYETPQTWFSAEDSTKIVEDIKKSDVIYTEVRAGTIKLNHAGPVWRSIDNKISMDGFKKLYDRCTAFVKPQK